MEFMIQINVINVIFKCFSNIPRAFKFDNNNYKIMKKLDSYLFWFPQKVQLILHDFVIHLVVNYQLVI